jgi:hypothetical protein
MSKLKKTTSLFALGYEGLFSSRLNWYRMIKEGRIQMTREDIEQTIGEESMTPTSLTVKEVETIHMGHTTVAEAAGMGPDSISSNQSSNRNMSVLQHNNKISQIYSHKKLEPNSNNFHSNKKSITISKAHRQVKILQTSTNNQPNNCKYINNSPKPAFDPNSLNELNHGNRISNGKSFLSCLYTNATSLANKISDLECRIIGKNPDVMFFTETWFNETNTQQMDGYKLFCRNRIWSTHGGVCIYVNNNFKSFENVEPEFLNQSIEQVWCTITSMGEKILLGCIYRPPKSTNNQPIFDSFKRARSLLDGKLVTGIIICGDFNLPSIEWDNNLVGHTNVRASESPEVSLLESLKDSFFTQNVNFATFIKSNGELGNVLDLVITEDSERILEIKSSAPLGCVNQGHSVLEWEYRLCGESSESKTIPAVLNYRRADFLRISSEFSKLEWSRIFKDKNANEMFESFLREYNIICKSCVPVKRKKVMKFNPKWLSPDLKKLSDDKNVLWIKCKQTNFRNKKLKEQYTEARNKCSKRIRQAVRKFERELASKAKRDPKLIFNYMNKKRKFKDEISAIKTSDGIITDKANIASQINEYFKSVFTSQDPSSEEPQLSKRTDKTFTINPFISFSPSNVEKYMNDLDVNKSPGPDKINPLVLKHCSNVLAVPLSAIFIKSYSDGIVPESWKTANVSPLHKGGSKLDVKNYRPVSLTSIVGKLMEKIIRNELMLYLLDNKLIDDKQHGFMPGKSCTTNLLEFIDKVTHEIDQGNYVDIIYTDFSKAFDKVSHRKLLVKLKAYGIVGEALEWIKAFLVGRYQRVVLGNVMSSTELVSSGVPQGSVLGPILFVIYINDLLQSFKSSCLSYADDLKLVSTVSRESSWSAELQQDLDILTEWAKIWSTELNLSKCKAMYLGTNRRKQEYYMPSSNGIQVLSETTVERDLGVIVSNDLKWNKQCSVAASKANRILGQIKNSFSYLDQVTFKFLYTALVRPHLEYAVSMWSPYTKTDIKIIEKVQRRATKLVKSIKGKSYEERLKALNLQNLEDRRLRGDLIQMFKLVNGVEKVNLVNGVKYAQSLSLNLRRPNNKRIVREINKRGSHRYNFLTNRIVSTWNQLPECAVSATTVNQFKARIDKEVFSINRGNDCNGSSWAKRGNALV